MLRLAVALQRTLLAGRLSSDVLSLVAVNCAVLSAWSLVVWFAWVFVGGHRWQQQDADGADAAHH